MGELVAAQELPDVLNWIDLRGIRRQFEQGDVVGNFGDSGDATLPFGGPWVALRCIASRRTPAKVVSATSAAIGTIAERIERQTGVQHPSREFLNPYGGCVHKAAACRRAGRPLRHLMEAD